MDFNVFEAFVVDKLCVQVHMIIDPETPFASIDPASCKFIEETNATLYFISGAFRPVSVGFSRSPIFEKAMKSVATYGGLPSFLQDAHDTVAAEIKAWQDQ